MKRKYIRAMRAMAYAALLKVFNGMSFAEMLPPALKDVDVKAELERAGQRVEAELKRKSRVIEVKAPVVRVKKEKVAKVKKATSPKSKQPSAKESKSAPKGNPLSATVKRTQTLRRPPKPAIPVDELSHAIAAAGEGE